jgi:pyridoxamine 5'-phosphate oxidase
MTPLETLAAWIAEAEAAGVPEPSAMALATVTADGVPSVRFMLCRGTDARGIRFFTNYESRKALELESTHRAAAAFHWARFARQVRVEGYVVRATTEESDAYFASRPRGHQLGAVVSTQSRPIGGLDELHARYRDLEARLEGGPVTRPSGWGGYWLVANAVELWLGRPDRLHERARYERERDTWRSTMLAP